MIRQMVYGAKALNDKKTVIATVFLSLSVSPLVAFTLSRCRLLNTAIAKAKHNALFR